MNKLIELFDKISEKDYEVSKDDVSTAGLLMKEAIPEEKAEVEKHIEEFVKRANNNG